MKRIKQHFTIVSPPVIFVSPFVLGMALQWLIPVFFIPWLAGISLGFACIVLAVILLTTARKAFREHRTTLLPNHRSRALLVKGPFRYTRNPLYLGIIFLYIGIAFGTGSIWSLLLLPLVILWLHYGAILPEEKSLEQQFGNEYIRYKKSVRRWL